MNALAGKESVQLSGLTPNDASINQVKIYWSNSSGVKGSLLTTISTTQGQSWNYQHNSLTVGLDYYYTADYCNGNTVLSNDAQVMDSPWLDDSSNLVIPLLLKDPCQISDTEFDALSSIAKIRPNIRINWIDLQKPTSFSSYKLQRLAEFVATGDELCYSPYMGMGFGDGGGQPIHTKQQTYDDIDAGYSQWLAQVGKYPYFFVWYGHKEMLQYIISTYGQKIALSCDWQAFRCDKNSSAGGFNQPFYPSKNHHLIPAREMVNALDIVNCEVQAADLYWSKTITNRPCPMAFQAMDLTAMQKTFRGALDIPNWDKTRKRYYFAVQELGYIYNVSSGKTISANIQLLKDWLKWVVRAYPNAVFPNLTELNEMFRTENPDNRGLRVDYQIGCGAYWSNANFPAKDDTNKIIMGWSKYSRFRLKLKEGAGGYVRLTDLLMHDDSVTPIIPENIYDQSVYSGMNHIELDNIGLLEKWTFSNGSTLVVNNPSSGTITNATCTIIAINQTNDNFTMTVEFKDASNNLILRKEFTVTPEQIKCKNTVGANYTATKLEFEDYKRTTNCKFLDVNGNEVTLASGTYTNNQATVTKTDIFPLELHNTMGTVSSVVVVQNNGTHDNWAGTGLADDIYIPTNFSSAKRVIDNPTNGGELGYILAETPEPFKVSYITHISQGLPFLCGIAKIVPQNVAQNIKLYADEICTIDGNTINNLTLNQSNIVERWIKNPSNIPMGVLFYDTNAETQYSTDGQNYSDPSARIEVAPNAVQKVWIKITPTQQTTYTLSWKTIQGVT